MEVGYELRHAFDALAHARDLKGRIQFAPQEKSRLCDAGYAVGGEKLPVAINIAVPVQSPAKTCAFELGRVRIDIGLGEPGGQGGGVASRVEGARLQIGQEGMPAFRRGGIARKPVQEAAHGCTNVAFEL